MGIQICVVGGGVVGLSTATLLQSALPSNTQIKLVADEFFTDTTSSVAAGIFRPGLRFQGPTDEITRQWLRDSYDFYTKLMNSAEGSIAGIIPIKGFHFSNKNPNMVWNDINIQNELIKPFLPEYRSCTNKELSTYGCKYGTMNHTLITDSTYYLPYLTRKFKSGGGVIEERHLDSLEELVGKYDIVCNCSGYGAKDLIADRNVIPIKGQVYKVRAPWIKNFYFHDYNTYIIPGIDYVTLGGTKDFDTYDPEINKYDSQSIWERCIQILPSLKDAQIVRECVGWRPYRSIIRVEKETMNFGPGKNLKVVHNYGHGSYGVMSAPGTSMYAVSLVKELLHQPKAKL